jgi:hypothetical protein
LSASGDNSGKIGRSTEWGGKRQWTKAPFLAGGFTKTLCLRLTMELCRSFKKTRVIIDEAGTVFGDSLVKAKKKKTVKHTVKVPKK